MATWIQILYIIGIPLPESNTTSTTSTPRKFNSSPLKIGRNQKGTACLPSIIFQGRAVKLQGCIIEQHFQPFHLRSIRFTQSPVTHMSWELEWWLHMSWVQRTSTNRPDPFQHPKGPSAWPNRCFFIGSDCTGDRVSWKRSRSDPFQNLIGCLMEPLKLSMALYIHVLFQSHHFWEYL